MTTYPKTTIGIAPEQTQALARLAMAMSITQTRSGAAVGNVSGLAQHLADLVRDYGPRVVAAALQQERLAALAALASEPGQEESDG